MNSDFIKERIAELEAQYEVENADLQKALPPGAGVVHDELPTEAEVRAAMGQDPNITLVGGSGVLRCHICDAPAGEVQLVKVSALGQTGYVCKGGDCRRQRDLALQRIVNRRMQRSLQASGLTAVDTAIAARKVRKQKAAKKQAKASRKANRG